MHLLLCQDHHGEGLYPTWPTGTAVANLEPCPTHPGWSHGRIGEHHAYFPDTLLQEGRLTAAYNPTELALPQGSEVRLIAVLHGWAWVEHQERRGWLPCGKLQSRDLPRFIPETAT